MARMMRRMVPTIDGLDADADLHRLSGHRAGGIQEFDGFLRRPKADFLEVLRKFLRYKIQNLLGASGVPAAYSMPA